MISREATNTNFIVFGLIWPGLEPTIYHTRREHAYHYATDTVVDIIGLFTPDSLNEKKGQYLYINKLYTLDI